MSNLDTILSKVRGLVQKAEHPSTPPDEADACRSKADALMLQYAITQATLRDSQPASQKAMPGKIMVDLCDMATPYEAFFIDLVAVINEHTRTKSVFYNVGSKAETMEFYRLHPQYATPKVQAQVYGFESDLKYFEIMYTTLLLHMSNGIDPKPDSSLSDEVNSYNLRNAGLNWGEIARVYYRLGHEYGWDGNKDNYMRFTGYWKRACNREVTRRGEQRIHIPGKVTDAARVNWRLNFAKSYVATIGRRLWIARMNRKGGSELILRSAFDAINEMMKEDHPVTNMMDNAKEVPYNEQAWKAGHNHGESADLGGTAMGRRIAGEL